MHELTERTKAVLREIIARGRVSIPALNEAMADETRGIVRNLANQRLVSCCTREGNDVREYFPTLKALRVLKAEVPAAGPLALPRTTIAGDGQYTGEAPKPMREGSMRAYELPSRTGDDLTPHRPPMSLSSHVQRRKPT